MATETAQDTADMSRGALEAEVQKYRDQESQRRAQADLGRVREILEGYRPAGVTDPLPEDTPRAVECVLDELDRKRREAENDAETMRLDALLTMNRPFAENPGEAFGNRSWLAKQIVGAVGGSKEDMRQARIAAVSDREDEVGQLTDAANYMRSYVTRLQGRINELAGDGIDDEQRVRMMADVIAADVYGGKAHRDGVDALDGMEKQRCYRMAREALVNMRRVDGQKTTEADTNA